MQRGGVRRSAAESGAAPQSVVQRGTVWESAARRGGMWRSAGKCDAARQSMAQRGRVWESVT
jgi:hypothetical protein